MFYSIYSFKYNTIRSFFSDPEFIIVYTNQLEQRVSRDVFKFFPKQNNTSRMKFFIWINLYKLTALLILQSPPSSRRWYECISIFRDNIIRVIIYVESVREINLRTRYKINIISFIIGTKQIPSALWTWKYFKKGILGRRTYFLSPITNVEMLKFKLHEKCL